MTRNTERRVEVAAPIKNPEIQKRLVDIFNTMLRDNVKARVQQPDGSYIRKPRAEGEELLDSQLYFYEQAYMNSEKYEQSAQPEKKTGILAKLKGLFKKN